LDLADDAAERIDGAVGVARHLSELAGELAIDPHPQIAFGHRGQHLLQRGQHVASARKQTVDRLGEAAQEALLARQVDASAEVALGRAAHDLRDFALDQHFGCAVHPLDHEAETFSVRAQHRRHRQAHDPRSDVERGRVGLLQLGQHAALVRRVAVEAVDAATQNRGGLEVRHHASDIGLGVLHHRQQRAVGVDDVEVTVGHHDIGGGHVQCTADALGLVGATARVGVVEAHLDLHRLHRQQQLADFVGAVDRQAVFVVTARHIA
jgi:hypothetical protein